MLFLPASLRFSVATGHFAAAAVRFDLIGEQGILLLAPIAYTSQLATPMPGCGLSVYDREHLRHGQDSPDPRWRQEAPLLSHRRSEEHTSELQSLMRISYAVFCLQKKKDTNQHKK